MTTAIIQSEARVPVGLEQARQWFMALEDHPERYRFDTHGGFAFTQGGFGEAGARFETWEQFYGLELRLGFRLTEVADTHFRFRLIRPPLPVWGAFVLERIDAQQTLLRLEIGATNRFGRVFLQLPPAKAAIRRQIRGEVENIQSSMEDLFSPQNSNAN
jgi:hypothetical protein